MSAPLPHPAISSGPHATSSSSDRVPVAIVGASGYTGAELIRLLWQHPRVSIAGLYARGNAGQPLGRVFPQFAGIAGLGDRVLAAFDETAVAAVAKVAFCALPHGDSARAVAQLVARGVTVLDPSAETSPVSSRGAIARIDAVG